jgi:AraC family transcriptional regulator
MELDIDGRRFGADASAASGLCYFPAHARIDGEFVVDHLSGYTAVFFDSGLMSDHGLRAPEQSMIGFGHGPLTRGLLELATQAPRPDAAFSLYVEGWALQSLAHLVRLAGQRPVPGTTGRVKGLPTASLRRVEERVRSRLAEPITVDELAEVAGFSRRHFLRAFKQSIGQTPLRYVQDLRLDEAKRQLIAGKRSITAIAIDCGFSHVQHFSTAFRKATGLSPTQYRNGNR